MTLTYEKITAETWDYKRDTPKCPPKGAFEIDFKGRICFVVDGELHRTDGPAEIWSNGSQKYFQHGKRHRLDGPAIIWSDGSQFYYQHGKLHRLDGPAVIRPNGTQIYYLFDKQYQKEDWELKVLQLNLKEQIV